MNFDSKRADPRLKTHFPALRQALALIVCGFLVSCVTNEPTSEGEEPDPTDQFGPRDVNASVLTNDLQNARATSSQMPSGRKPLAISEYAKWERNPRRAFSKARALDRPLLLLFTATSWSENARKLGDEVFLSKTFNEFARENFSLAFLDFPQSQGSAPEALQNLKEKYEVRGFPTVLLLDRDAHVIFRKGGYTPGKAKDYFNELKSATEAARRQSS